MRARRVHALSLPCTSGLSAAAAALLAAWASLGAPQAHGKASEQVVTTGKRPGGESFDACLEHEVLAALRAPRMPLSLAQATDQVGRFCRRFGASSERIATETAERYRAYNLIETGVRLSSWVADQPRLYAWLVDLLGLSGYVCRSISDLQLFRSSYVVSCNHHEAWFMVDRQGVLRRAHGPR